MDISTIQNPLAQRVAEAMIEGFNRHYRNMRLYGQQAKRLFDTAQWLEVQKAVRERIRSYDERVDDNVARLRAEFDAGAPVIVFAGRAESVRGVDTLIEAFPMVLAAVPDARLRLLLIERPELASLVEMIRAAGMGDRVEVVTETRQDLLADMADAQVGVWPFKFDYTTSPPAMAVTEALAVGLPVVATQVACVAAALTDGRGGYLVPPMDATALAAAITSLLTDEAKWQAQSAAGPSAVRRLSWELTAETTAAAYELAVGN